MIINLLPVQLHVESPRDLYWAPFCSLYIINDMHKASSLQCIHYADDTTLFSKGNNLDELIDFTNNELVKIDKWNGANKLSLNPLTPRRTLVAPFTEISILF